ncbi:MAG: EscU/YscU/HrcU family type III secretion system export apparatus switch protein [Defluviitaleaceae bacterium]|nr:EscU/YscU/HrcU family type III secretion system export apparatus switch protein [Defluviitaleaceae bacterium]
MSKQAPEFKKKAVALQYKLGFAAPKVVATGTGQIAQRIMDIAQESEVRLYKDAKLAAALTKVNLGDEIPPELYQVVAQILVFIDNLDALEAMKTYDQQS